ncbi:hypothetical protein RIF29_20673 [Crotalaria pallida]|uniref:Uncharacterized protein n=1 Tax=Crotalaria pallida TaxID=3830 RepID=A0AAN9F508_CROPI
MVLDGIRKVNLMCRIGKKGKEVSELNGKLKFKISSCGGVRRLLSKSLRSQSCIRFLEPFNSACAMDGDKASVGCRRSKRKRVLLDDGGVGKTKPPYFSSFENSVVEGYQSVGQSSCRRRIAFRNSLLGNVPISGGFDSNLTTQEHALLDITNQLSFVGGLNTVQRKQAHVCQDSSDNIADKTLISEVGKHNVLDLKHVTEVVPAVRMMNSPQRNQAHGFEDTSNHSEICLVNTIDTKELSLNYEVGKDSLLDVQHVTQVSQYRHHDPKLSGLRGSANVFRESEIQRYILESRQQVERIMSTLPDSNEQSSRIYASHERNKDGRNIGCDCVGLDQVVEVVDNRAGCCVVISPRKGQKVSTGAGNQIVCDLSKKLMDGKGACAAVHDDESYRDEGVIGTSGCLTNLRNLHSPLSLVKGRKLHYKSLKKILAEISERSTKDTEVVVEDIDSVRLDKRKRQQCVVQGGKEKVAKDVYNIGADSVHSREEINESGHEQMRCVEVSYISEVNPNQVKSNILSGASGEEEDELQEVIVQNLKEMIDMYNPIAKVFRMARDRLQGQVVDDLKLRLIRKRSKDSRMYNLPM